MAKWSDNAKVVLESRYLIKDSDGVIIETPDQMLERVAASVAKVEKDSSVWREKFLSVMDTLEFLPNSPTLMNAGKKNGQLSACFVLPIEDSLSHILEMVKQTAMIHKTGGGTGLIFSHLRPADSKVNSTMGVASGPVSFMRIFDTATDVVKQGGVRRGANMGILHCTHPDIITFIRCKEDLSRFQNFNISIAITDDFMAAAKNGGGFSLRNPYTKEKIAVDAGDIFNIMCEQMWLTGEPGVIFIDIINHKNPIPWMGRIEGTNPCGEQPLLPYESCNLGSIDISKFIFGKKLDWDRLAEVVAIAIRFLDNVVDANCYPNIRIERKTKITRKVGLGIMGWADALVALGIKYDDDRALRFAKRLMMNIREIAHITSRELGEEKGFCFDQLKRRNSCLTTLAPTGTLSILAGCSSGIEPLFGKKIEKRVLGDKVLDLSPVVDRSNERFIVSAHEISAEKHVKMQAEFQGYTDNAVSKTVNFPSTSTVSDIKKTIILAHELGCKGITCYRYGSRDGPITISTEGVLSECDNGKCAI